MRSADIRRSSNDVISTGDFRKVSGTNGSVHIPEKKLLEVVSDHVTLSKEETAHLSTCVICLEALREEVRKDLSGGSNSEPDSDVKAR
jgi:hypothetical protein